MKNYHKSLFFVFTLSVLIIAPNLHANAMELTNSKMMDHKLTNTSIPVTIPLTKGYVKGSEVLYISTEASDKGLAENLTKLTGFRVVYAPILQKTPADALAQIYAFENGIKGTGPLGFQPNVADSQPGDLNYSPLWAVNIVKWNDGITPRELKSQTEIIAAQTKGELKVTSSGFIVNCPFVQWNGGSLQIRDDKTLTDDTTYGGGQVLKIDTEKMQATFVAHRGFGPDGSTIYYIATDASKQDVADMLGVTFVERTGGTLLSAASSDLYVFTNGIKGTGPMGFQASIGSTHVGNEYYSPMWRIQATTWANPSSADFLTMTSQITSAGSKGALATEVAGVVVNCPFIEVDKKFMIDDITMKDNMKDNMMGHMDSPRKQMKMGVDVHTIQCKSGYEIVFKSTNWFPSCVKSSSVDKLIQRGWASAHSPNHDTSKMPTNAKLMANATNTITMNVEEIDGVYRWSSDQVPNPTLTLWANVDNTIQINNPTDEKHEFVIESQTIEIVASEDIIADGNGNVTIKPNMEDTLEYHCEYHPDTMKGQIKIISP